MKGIYSLLCDFFSWAVRFEGRKFLALGEGVDDSLLVPSPERGNSALYIHIPFCKQLCPYCSFNRFLYHEDKVRRYFRSLRRELDFYLERGFRFSSFYFGGGTPTVQMDELISFFDYLHARLPVEEISLETNPRDITPENVKILKDLGVKRLSMGVQSFDDGMLRAMGRLSHTGAEAVEKVRLAQGQFDTFNIDLLYNFPSQSLEQFHRDILCVKELEVDQVTFYPLMPAPKKRELMERRFSRVDTARERRFYDLILEEIYHDGYHPSTVWCFSRGERMIDEYIIDYEDYIAIGSGSVGLYEGLFYVNSFSLENYNQMVSEGRLPIVMSRILPRRDLLRYYLLTKLFGMKIDKEAHRRRFGRGIYRDLGLDLALFRLLGIVKEDERWVRVTERGMYFVSGMMREFFTALNRLREYCMVGGI